jgi:hypothetical protein
MLFPEHPVTRPEFESARQISSFAAWEAMNRPVARRLADYALAPCWNVAQHRQQDRHPSLRLGCGSGRLGNGWRCFACGQKGDAIQLVQAVQGGEPLDAARWLAERCAHLPIASVSDAAREPVAPPEPFSARDEMGALEHTPSVVRYLAERGLTDLERLRALGVGVVRRGVDDWLGFAYHERGEGAAHERVLFWKLRNLAHDKNRRRIFLSRKCPLEHHPLYLERFLGGGDRAFVTEGEIDALSLALSGCENVVSLPQGTSSAARVDLSRLSAYRTVYVATDSDDAGDRAAQVLARRLYAGGVVECRRLVFWLDRPGTTRALAKDANDALLAGCNILSALDGAALMPKPQTKAEQPESGRFDPSVAGANPIPIRPETKRVREHYDTDVIPDDLEVPPGYVVLPDGAVARESGEVTQDGRPEFTIVLPRAIVPIKRYYDIDPPNTEYLELAYPWGARMTWRRSIVPLSSCTASREIVKLSAQGIPCDDGLAKGSVAWIRAFLLHNQARLEHERLTHRCGWFRSPEGRTSFALGSRVYSTDGALPLRTESRDGLGTMFAGMEPQGVRDRQVDIIRRVCSSAPCPASALVLASFASPLYSLINPESSAFFLHSWCTTSRGKTSALVIAASVWGMPSRMIHDWTGTNFSQQVIAKSLSALPMCLDELQAITRFAGEQRSEALYQITNGRGKTQGTADGSLRDPPRWCLIGLSTGERPATDMTPNPGMLGRVLELEGDPFADGTSAMTIDEMRTQAATHSGHVGHDWIEWLVRNLDVAGWSERRIAATARLSAFVADLHHPMAARWAGHLGCLEVTAELLAESGILGPLPLRTLPYWMLGRLCEGHVVEEERDEDTKPGGEDLGWLQSWTGANASSLDAVDRPSTSGGRPIMGFRVDRRVVGLFPASLSEALRARGVSSRAFRARLRATPSGVEDGPVYIGRKLVTTYLGRTWLHCFTWDGLSLPKSPAESV